jgi:acetoin utilization deacetylase AcuC-like enzyme
MLIYKPWLITYYLPDLLSEIEPDIVFYDAGVDTYIDDKLSKPALTDTGDYPVACVIGGGYADDIKSLVWRHSLLHRAASLTYHQFHL